MNILRDISDLLAPRLCMMCRERLSAQEGPVCTSCYMHLPFTKYHLVEHSPLEKQFWGLFPVGKAVAMFHHDGEKTRHIIYSMKYWRHPSVGRWLAETFAEELKEVNFFADIDGIVPLPLHWHRQLSRRYNQSHYIAEGIHNRTGLPIWKDVVKRVKDNPPQVHKKGVERRENVDGVFRLTRPERIANRHVLLVDDVATTGSTLASCAQELAKAPNVKISVLTLAIAARTALPFPKNDTPEASVFGMPLME